MAKIIETENDVKAIVKKMLDEAGAWSYAPIQTGMGVHGIPDRIACLPIEITPEMVGLTVGVLVAPECKRPGRRGEKNAGATSAQVNVMEEIIAAGGVALMIDGQHDVDFLRGVIARNALFHVDWAETLKLRTKKNG